MGANNAKEQAQHIPIGADDESIQKRKQLFKAFDTDENNLISLLQFHKGLHQTLDLPKLFDTIPVVIRSYGVAIGKVKEVLPISEDEQLQMTPGVFKWILMYVRFYYEIWCDFQRIEAEKENQSYISIKELLKGQEVLIKDWNLGTEDLERIFQEVLKEYNEENRVSFIHFCDYLIRERLKKFQDLEAHDQY